MKEKLVLGIETSCDETGVALYSSHRGLLSQALHSQVALHRPYGGVVPEVASRDHQQRLLPLVEKVLQEGSSTLAELDAIAYTAGPGLVGALLIGACFAEGLAYALKIVALPIHHLEGHLLSPMLSTNPPDFPFLALLVSGAHTQLMHVQGLGQYQLLGETLDDAVGEAFDKSARLLSLDYPGGPALEKLAQKGQAGIFHLPRPMLKQDNLSFSFSGLKTALALQVAATPLDAQKRADLACEFQQAICEVLVGKTLAAVKKTGLKQVVLAGGVAANQAVRQSLELALKGVGGLLHVPEKIFCTDNGAMIALVGALRLEASGEGREAITARAFSVHPRWSLEAVSMKNQPLQREMMKS